MEWSLRRSKRIPINRRQALVLCSWCRIHAILHRVELEVPGVERAPQAGHVGIQSECLIEVLRRNRKAYIKLYICGGVGTAWRKGAPLVRIAADLQKRHGRTQESCKV